MIDKYCKRHLEIYIYIYIYIERERERERGREIYTKSIKSYIYIYFKNRFSYFYIYNIRNGWTRRTELNGRAIPEGYTRWLNEGKPKTSAVRWLLWRGRRLSHHHNDINALLGAGANVMTALRQLLNYMNICIFI